ncbi:ABC transporter substrate-binding protein [Paenibacillus alkalitolerans]|uniref:ABC transporter substrate-binding protein n=1 Tax=Paenibacillus alkalitolerans TaxID=2799335 RepID=UPI002D7FC81D|nr:extracellular solute-binding protein [Paenibacillus alkalitolerans]
MKRIVLLTLSVLLMFSMLLIGCSQRTGNSAAPAGETTAPSDSASKETIGGDGAKVKLTVYSTTNDKPVQEVFKQIAADFTKENPNIAVDLQFPGSEYENIMKVKMAANDLPDVFDTHGWAVMRYGKYLADLRDEAWVADQTDTIKDVVTDKDGKVHALVMSEAKDGLTYNVDLLKKYNIEPPKTFDELMAAAEKIKTESGGEVTPFFFSGIDDWMIGQFFDYFATSLLISPAQNEADNLLNKTFDWSKWTPLPEKFLEMYNKGYINKDVLTAKYSDLPQQFADGKVAFTLLGPSFADEVHKINPDLKIGFMPVPSMVEGDEPNFSGGERYTFGAWKDSKHLEEAKKFIAYFAKPENIEKIANVTKLPPGLKNIKASHEFTEYYEKYADIRVFPYFDRVYLPSGMWDVMCKTGSALLGGQVTPEQYSEKMKSEAERLSNK